MEMVRTGAVHRLQQFTPTCSRGRMNMVTKNCPQHGDGRRFGGGEASVTNAAQDDHSSPSGPRGFAADFQGLARRDDFHLGVIAFLRAKIRHMHHRGRRSLSSPGTMPAMNSEADGTVPPAASVSKHRVLRLGGVNRACTDALTVTAVEKSWMAHCISGICKSSTT